jgi:hypothetical protein
MTVAADGAIRDIKLTLSTGYARLDDACLQAFSKGGFTSSCRRWQADRCIGRDANHLENHTLRVPPFIFRIQKPQATQKSIAMKIRFPIFLVIIGCISGSYASTVDSPTLVVRVRRAESNAAIKAHDAVRLRKLFDDDYHGIQGTSGDLHSGGDATASSYADEEFKDPTFVTYRRTPTSIVNALSGKRVAEAGHWEGIWQSQMEPCERRVCTLQCGFRREALGALNRKPL